MKLFDQQGNATEVPDDQAGAAISSGKFGLPVGAKVPVKLADGRIGTVPVEGVTGALQKGASVVSQQAYDDHQEQKQYGQDVGHEAAAVGLGALNNLSLGGTNALAGALGGGVGDFVKHTEHANPGLTTTGEIASLAVPLLGEAGEGSTLARGSIEAGEALDAAQSAANASSHFGNTAANALKAPIKLLGAPLRGLNEVGGVVEKGIAKIVGDEATSLAGKIVQKAAGAAGRGAIEGGILSGGQEIGEEELGDPELNGQKILASIGHGALLGLAGGAGLSAAGEIGSNVFGRVASKLSGSAEEQAFRALDPIKKFVVKGEDIPGGIKSIGRQMLDDGIIEAGDTVETIAPKVEAAKQKAGARIGEVLDNADAQGFEGPSVRSIFDELETKTIPKLDKLPSLNGSALQQLRSLQSDLLGELGIPSAEEALATGVDRAGMIDKARFSFKQAQDLRASIDDKIKNFATVPGVSNSTQEALKDVRFAMEREIESAGDKAAKKLGGSFLDEYQEAKLAYRRYVVANQAVESGAAGRIARRVLSPSDYGAGAVGSLLGHGAAHGAGGPLVGLATSVAHHFVRERGNSTAAVALDKLSALGAVKRAAAAVDREVDRGVQRALGNSDRAIPRTKFVGGDYESKKDAIVRAVASPEVHAQQVEQAAGPIAAHAPGVAAAFQKAALRATIYLAKQLPQGASPGNSITPNAKGIRNADVSNSEKERWESLYDVVHDPNNLLANVESGTLTTDQVDAVKQTHPDVYAEMYSKFEAELANHHGDLAVPQLLAIGTFLGKTPDEALSPEFTALMQGNYGAGAGPKQPKGKHGGAAKGTPARQINLVNPYKLAGTKDI